MSPPPIIVEVRVSKTSKTKMRITATPESFMDFRAGRSPCIVSRLTGIAYVLDSPIDYPLDFYVRSKLRPKS